MDHSEPSKVHVSPLLNSSHFVVLGLFTEVTNASVIRERLVDGTLQAAVIDCRLVSLRIHSSICYKRSIWDHNVKWAKFRNIDYQLLNLTIDNLYYVTQPTNHPSPPPPHTLAVVVFIQQANPDKKNV